MNWYVAHTIVLVKYKDGIQDNFPIWENLVLVSAEDSNEAWAKALEFGREGERDDMGSYTCDDRPAERVLVGIRKIVQCGDGPFEDGLELTYSQIEVESKEDLDKLVDGKEVNVLYTK